jgi:transposase
MGKPYADDLRMVVVGLIEEGHTRPEVAEICGISLSSVGRFIRRYRTSGSVSPAKFGGYKGYSLAKHADRIRQWIAEHSDLTLVELQGRLAKARIKVAASSVFRFLRHLKLTFKKSAARRRAGTSGRRRRAPAMAALSSQSRYPAAGVHR